MITSFGCGFSEGYMNDFDISSSAMTKIIIMARCRRRRCAYRYAASDSFYRYMPDLSLTKAMSISLCRLFIRWFRRREGVYLYDDKALERYRKTHAGSKFTLQRYKRFGGDGSAAAGETTLGSEDQEAAPHRDRGCAASSDITEVLMGTGRSRRARISFTSTCAGCGTGRITGEPLHFTGGNRR